MGWLSGWTYRKSHAINGATGAGTGYQVKVKVHRGSGTDSGEDVYLGGKLGLDYGDIRFTNDDGQTLLDHWLETLDMFDKYGSNPLDLPYGSDDARACHPDCLYFPSQQDGYKYWLYYETVKSSPNEERIRLVRSNDGLSFVETGITNPIVDIGGAGSWDEKCVCDQSVLKIGSTWYLWYCGVNNGSIAAIGLATSSDGKSWTKITDGIGGTSKVLQALGSGDEGGNWLCSPSVWYDQETSTFCMWYVSRVDGGSYVVRLAHSSDGKSWTRDGTVYSPSNMWHITVTRDETRNKFYMYWNHHPDSPGGLHLACSTNKTSWSISDSFYDPVMCVIDDSGWDEQNIYASKPIHDEYGDIILVSNLMEFYYSASRQPTNSYYRVGQAKQKEYVTFWIEVADDLGSNQTIYIYYKKDSADSVSNGPNTFSNFNNFNDNTLTDWTKIAGQDLVEQDKMLELIYASDPYYSEYYKNIAGQTDQSVTAKIKGRTDSSTLGMGLLLRKESGATRTFYFCWLDFSGNLISIYKIIDGSFTKIGTDVSYTFTKLKWCKVEFRVYGSTLKVLIDDVEKRSETNSDITVGTYSGVRAYKNTAFWDDFRTRKFISPEPSHGSWGNEETEETQINVSDSAMGSETVSRPQREMMLTEAGTGVETIGKLRSIATILDSLLGAESILAAKAFTVLDSALGAEAVTRPQRVMTVTDLANGLEAIFKLRELAAVTDGAAGLELVTVGVAGVVKTKIFLILGNLAIQLAGD